MRQPWLNKKAGKLVGPLEPNNGCTLSLPGTKSTNLSGDSYFFLVVALNDTPNRIETLRMRSGVRFMIRAASSNDFDALASWITRRSCANDQDRAIRKALLEDKAAQRVVR